MTTEIDIERPATAHRALVDGLVAELETGRIESVAFVVRSDVSWAWPLYDVAITTARRGWRLGIPAARYWLITPEPQPLATLGAAMSEFAHERLEPEGITFIGSTYAHVRHGVVLLDPQDERIHADRIVTLSGGVGRDRTIVPAPLRDRPAPAMLVTD
jgi:hypothetical protein